MLMISSESDDHFIQLAIRFPQSLSYNIRDNDHQKKFRPNIPTRRDRHLCTQHQDVTINKDLKIIARDRDCSDSE